MFRNNYSKEGTGALGLKKDLSTANHFQFQVSLNEAKSCVEQSLKSWGCDSSRKKCQQDCPWGPKAKLLPTMGNKLFNTNK